MLAPLTDARNDWPVLSLRVYLDTCCFNRPFDEAQLDRIAIEAEAILRIVARIEAGTWQLIVSDVVLYELRRIPDVVRRSACLAMAELAIHHERASVATTSAAKSLESLGIGRFDAAHLAFAMAARADVFLTVDDRLLRRAKGLVLLSPVTVDNPVAWIAGQGHGGEL